MLVDSHPRISPATFRITPGNLGPPVLMNGCPGVTLVAFRPHLLVDSPCNFPFPGTHRSFFSFLAAQPVVGLHPSELWGLWKSWESAIRDTDGLMDVGVYAAEARSWKDRPLCVEDSRQEVTQCSFLGWGREEYHLYLNWGQVGSLVARETRGAGPSLPLW